MSTNNDGSESVDQFLARIASIKGRDEDDQARTRRMEDEILKGRQERQARRLERARSISPSKTGPAKVFSTTPSRPTSQSITDLALNPPVDFSPTTTHTQQPPQSPSQSLSRSNAVVGRSSPTRDLDPLPNRPLPSPSSLEASPRPQPPATGLARSGTLSWQQRPSSRDGARQRPLSGIATVRSLPKPPPPQDDQDVQQSRQDIAASLAMKDPTWFRQTQDRGTGSAAFRKNQVEDLSEPLQSTSMRLPGMSEAREPSKSPAPDDRNGHESPRNLSDIDRFKRGTTPDIVAMRNSIAMEKSPTRAAGQRSTDVGSRNFENDASEASTPSLARTSSALSSNRPVSPTKGLGGFVESAMMKRSDSVNKRWSVKANTGLKRGDSVVGGRPPSLHSRGLSRDLPTTRDGTPSSPLASSRPGSTHGREDLGAQEKAGPIDPQERTSVHKPKVVPEESDGSLLARSPSKTMDPRRWSPTKSTWLESALQAESPKPPPLKEEQPKWKVDLQRSKSRASRDISPDKGPQKQETEVSAVKPLLSAATSPPPLVAKPATISSVARPQGMDHTASPKQNTPTGRAEPLSSKASDITAAKLDTSLKSRATEEESETIEADPSDTPKKAPVTKPKPQTPPRTDFRAALKSRGTGSGQSNETEPEFKAMFGKLKRATTQNYVAPDELKTNILSGKAALNVTGGPQKTKRVDEFKESILAKKEAMKASSVKPSERSQSPVKHEAPVPEALARRKTLSKATSNPETASITSSARGTPLIPAEKPAFSSLTGRGASEISRKEETKAPPVAAKPAMSIVRDIKPASTDSPAVTEHQVLPKTLAINSAAPEGPKTDTFSAKQADLGNPAKITGTAGTTSSMQARAAPLSIDHSPPKSAAKGELPPGSKLASRLNPNLAAMLSRGGSPRPQIDRGVSDDSVPKIIGTSVGSEGNDGSGSLTHMTKARAKGPKRRAPKAEGQTATKSISRKSEPRSPPIKQHHPVSSATSELEKLVESTKSKDTPQKPSMALRELPQPTTPASSRSPVKMQQEGKILTPRAEETITEEPKQRPMIANKSPELRKASNQNGIDDKIKSSPKPISSSKPSWSPAPKPTLVEKNNNITPVQTMSPTPPAKSNLVLNRVRSAETSTQKHESKPEPASPRLTTASGLGLGIKPAVTAPKPTPKPQAQSPPVQKQEEMKVGTLPAKIRNVVENYVGPILKDYERAEFDAQKFLAEAKGDDGRVKTLNYTIHEITGDGKKAALPPQQEHMLFEDCMYLITHAFSTSGGTSSTEVYLWCGDRVSDAAKDDAQIFCRRDAREHNTKLMVFNQGKESSQLIQALGGILIVRRNKSSALYMLCGRRHLGHIVFDEVEMESSQLCPGYAYLISAQYGKLFLWKGKGACADEVGSARLIGMDLGLTGEIEEVDEGAEPPSFWEAFGSKTRGAWSDDWTKRAEVKGYPSVMYRVEHERAGILGSLWRSASPTKGLSKASCERVESFVQGDLDSSTIHILDAYRNIYVIVTRQCSSKAAELVSALHLAQDFAMLSPATQDRPLVPASYLVVGSLPDDAKACFRKWSVLEAHSIVKKDSICVRLEDAMEALDL